MNIQVGTPPCRTVQVQFGFVADLRCAENETRRGRSFEFAPAFPSAARSTKLSPFTQRSPMGSMVMESTGPILGLSASAIAAFLASSTVSKSPGKALGRAVWQNSRCWISCPHDKAATADQQRHGHDRKTVVVQLQGSWYVKARIFTISAAWDAEASVWSGHCDELPAAADAPTLDELLARISAVAIDLLPDNHPDIDPASLFVQITALREAERSDWSNFKEDVMPDQRETDCNFQH